MPNPHMPPKQPLLLALTHPTRKRQSSVIVFEVSDFGKRSLAHLLLACDATTTLASAHCDERHP